MTNDGRGRKLLKDPKSKPPGFFRQMSRDSVLISEKIFENEAHFLSVPLSLSVELGLGLGLVFGLRLTVERGTGVCS
jgi:hypothetical protein